MTIDVDAGSCRIETDIQCNMLEADVDAGSATLKNIEAGWVNLDCDAGKITFEGSVSDSGEVDVDAGSIDITRLKADAGDYNYDINVSAGSLTINDKKISGLDHEQLRRYWRLSGCGPNHYPAFMPSSRFYRHRLIRLYRGGNYYSGRKINKQCG